MDVRTQRLIKYINIKGAGLELGPLTSPILTKEAANIHYVDHLSLADLKEKYRNEPVELDEIVEPDFVLGNKSLLETVGRKRFDYIIASHVIEHIPDTVRWLQDLSKVLRPGGVVSLAIPDKRFTFDITRQISTPAQVMGAYYDKLTRSSSAMMYDFARECSIDIDSGTAWSDPGAYAKTKKRWSAGEVQTMCGENLDPHKYVDCHCYVYTPSSFITIMEELMRLGLFNYEVAGMLETQTGELEFYVSLRKIEETDPAKQTKSLPRIEEPTMAEDLAHEVEILKQEIHMIKHSISWKVTRPVRKIRGLLRRP